MPTILIADAGKSSLVMTSEVFKDKIPGCKVVVSPTGEETLRLVELEKPDMCVVDFDLPDADGVSLIIAMRKLYSGPILLTAYPDKIVHDAVAADLFAFNDAGAWLSKPVKFDELSAKIDTFLVNNQRLGRRFPVQFKSMLIGKGAGRGKRAPKADVNVVNLSLGGAGVKLTTPMKIKGGQELSLAISLPTAKDSGKPLAHIMGAVKAEPAKTSAASKKKGKKKGKETPKTKDHRSGARCLETKIKAKVAWADDSKKSLGLAFTALTDVQKQGLERLLKQIAFAPRV